MSKVIILGSSNAIPTRASDTTHMVIVGNERMVLVDSGSNPILRLEEAGLELDNLTDLIVTHFHPDHASGIPILLMDMWLMGRQKSLNIYGLQHALDRVEGLMGFYNWESWPNFFPVAFHRIPSKEMTEVLDCADFRICASPVHHMVPNIGLRIDFSESKTVMVYSCDSEPCDEVVRLGTGADILIHEAAGETPGHSSARQAGEIAAKAGAGMLYLIHYPTGRFANGDLVAEARTAFSREIVLARDFMEVVLDKKTPLPQVGKRRKGGKIYQPEI
jgi:ribonuclease Z